MQTAVLALILSVQCSRLDDYRPHTHHTPPCHPRPLPRRPGPLPTVPHQRRGVHHGDPARLLQAVDHRPQAPHGALLGVATQVPPPRALPPHCQQVGGGVRKVCACVWVCVHVHVCMCARQFLIHCLLSKSHTHAAHTHTHTHAAHTHTHTHAAHTHTHTHTHRNTETGEGHFFFTGWHIKRLFETMKEMMTRGARVLPGPEPSRRDLGYFLTKTPVNSQLLLNGSDLSVNTTNSCPPLTQRATPRDLVQADSDSEDDSTSTDSGNSSGVGGVGGVFNNAPGNTQTSRSLPASSALSSPPPLPPRDPVVRRGSTNPHSRHHYMGIIPATRIPLDDYVTIRRQPGYYRDPRSIHVAESNPHHEAVAGRSGEADSSSDDGEQPREEPDTSHYSVPRRAKNFGLPPIPPARKTSSLSTAGQ